MSLLQTIYQTEQNASGNLTLRCHNSP